MKGKEKEKNQNIQVSVRCRPINNIEKKQGSYSVTQCNADKHEVIVKERLGVNPSTKTFFFDHVFPPASKQIDVYKKVVTPCIDEVLMGYNCTIFAYGQTGTGKTFTMEGDRTENCDVSWEEDPLAGIIPRAMFNIFEQLKTQDVEFSVRVSFLELYNEELFDLLGSTEEALRLKIYEDSTKKGSVIIQNLEEVVVRNKDEVYEILKRGSERRQTAATLMNATSSRSHTVFSVTIHIKENTCDGEELLKTGKLYLVDLAGSENIGRSGAVDKRAREAGNINQSLLTLGRVITALVEHAPHVPYRESKLTRLLQDSLGGRTKTSIIATISPASCNLEETLSTLDYAFRAKNIQNRPEVNQKLTKKALLREYNEEIERLRRDLQASREKNGIFLAEENYIAMQSKIQQQIDTIKEMEEKIECLIEERDKVTELFTFTKQELEETSEELKVTSKRLVKTTENLHNTQNDLIQTTQERDEQTYLVSEHVKTETQLYSEANQLLNTVESSVADLEGVHDKLDRKRKVESHNEQCQQTFLETLQEQIQNMQSQLNDFTREQKSFHTTLAKNSADLLSSRSQQVKALQSCVDDLKTRIPVNMETVDGHYQSITDTYTQWMNQGLQDTNSTKDEECQYLKQFAADVFLPLMSTVHDTLNASTSVLQQLQNDHLPKLQTVRNDAIEAHTEKMKAELASLQSMIEEYVGSQEAENEKMQEDIEQQEALNQAIADLLVQKNELMKKTSDRVHGRSKTLKELKSQFSCQMTKLTDSTNVHKDETVAKETDWYSQEQEELKKALVETETCKEHCDSITCKVTEFHEQRQQVLEKFSQQVSESVAEHQSHINSHRDEHKESIKRIEGKWSSALESMSCDMTQQEARFETDVGDMADTMLKQSSSISDWSQEMTCHLNKCDEDFVKFIKEDMKKDIPTGLTPQRRNFSYPTNPTKTDDHSTLVESFRGTYKPLVLNLSDHLDTVAEDMPLELVGTSCEEIRDDVSEAGSDVSCTSTTSGISTMSSKSTRSNVSKSSECKENRMKPPSIKTALKRTKTPGVNLTPRGKSKLPLKNSNSGDY